MTVYIILGMVGEWQILIIVLLLLLLLFGKRIAGAGGAKGVMNKKLPSEEREERQIYLYFEPERRLLQMYNSTGLGSGDIAGGTFSTISQGTGAFIKMFPGMGLVGDIVSGTGKVVGKGLKAGGNALDNSAFKAECQRVKSGNVDRGISDAEYDRFVKNCVMDFEKMKQRALVSLALDETQIAEAPPICFEDYFFNKNDENQLVARGKDGIERTSSFLATWLFFTTKQLCIYQYIYDVLAGTRHENTEKYFWKNIINVATSNTTIAGREQKSFVIKTSVGDCKYTYKNNADTESAINYINNQLEKIKQTQMINIENVSNSNIVINSKEVQNTIKIIKERFDEETASVIREIAGIVEKSKNAEAVELFNAFNEEINKPEPKKSLLKNIWNGLSSVLPVLSSTISIVEKVMKIIN